LAIGLFASASRAERFRAVRLAITGYMLFAIIPWLLSMILDSAKLLSGVSPLVLMLAAADDKYQSGPESYWTSLGMVNALAWMFLLLAAVRLRRNWVDRAQGICVVEAQTIRPVPLPKRWRFRGADLSDPIAWLVSHQHGIRLLPWWAA